MSFLDALLATGECEVQYSFKCKDGRVQLRFFVDGERVKGVLGAGDWMKSLEQRGPDVLPHITQEVQLVIKTSRQISARFTGAECAEVLCGKWPCNDTFDTILRRVTERSRYPLPKPEIPGGGGKSMTAQGQTKKPGSHSSARHG